MAYDFVLFWKAFGPLSRKRKRMRNIKFVFHRLRIFCRNFRKSFHRLRNSAFQRRNLFQ